MRIAAPLLPFAAALAALLGSAAGSIVAQNEPAPVGSPRKVALPHGTGEIEVPAQWIALGPDELAAETRDTDPVDDPARMFVIATVNELRANNRTNDNVLLHSPGASKGQVRTINAYSADVEATVEELQLQKTVNQIRSALEEGLAAPGVEVVFVGHDEPDLFAIGSIAVTFRIETPAGSILNQMHVVPAGERIQYFETQFAPDDMDAPVAISKVLGSFNGASEPAENDILRNMLIGGAAGAIAGISVALIRRRRQGAPRIGVDSGSTAD